MTVPPTLQTGYAALIASDRVSERTRTALLDRAQPDGAAYQPAAMSALGFGTLQAMMRRVLPQSATPIDLAQRLDAMLAEGTGDGWRFADLPSDREAYAAGLAALDAWSHTAHGAAFSDLPSAVQDAMLSDLAQGGAPGGGSLSPAQLTRWFQDVRGDATRLYVAHPATMARMGYSGIGYGGDTERLPGFHSLEPGGREPWEPTPGGSEFGDLGGITP